MIAPIFFALSVPFHSHILECRDKILKKKFEILMFISGGDKIDYYLDGIVNYVFVGISDTKSYSTRNERFKQFRRRFIFCQIIFTQEFRILLNYLI